MYLVLVWHDVREESLKVNWIRVHLEQTTRNAKKQNENAAEIIIEMAKCKVLMPSLMMDFSFRQYMMRAHWTGSAVYGTRLENEFELLRASQ